MFVYGVKFYQSGAVLVVGLLMLMVLSLIGVSSMQSAGLQILMVQGSEDRALAFEATEAALREAALALDERLFLPEEFEFDEDDGLFQNRFHQIWKEWSASDWSLKARHVAYPEVALRPAYVVQRIATVIPNQDHVNVYQAYGQVNDGAETELFRITARGVGRSDKTIVYLESLHGARF